ncbi:hypothetical protein [Sphingosinicella sp.]|uniref:hypothetical protein n=1 Tax=Sphingosinicella sp. TaxID=1917971 RepID=UPI00403848D7
MKMEELPRTVWWTALGVMPVLIAMGLLIAVTVVAQLSVESEVPIRALFIAVVMYLLAGTVRAVLSCIDWFEARRAKKAAPDG